MTTTSASLLLRLRENPTDADWQRFVDLYTSFLQDQLRPFRLPAADADDLLQDVFTTVFREIPGFQYDPQRGPFRGWLRTVLTNRLRWYWRSRSRKAQPLGADFEQLLEHLEDPHSDLSQQWDRDHDQHVLRRLLALIEPEFEPTTWRAFVGTVLEERDVVEVAARLGLSANAVYIARSRVLRRLRAEKDQLVDSN